VHFSARNYDPATGRFLQRDPAEPNLREIETMRWYDFAEGNPNVNSDATGLFTISSQMGTQTIQNVLSGIARTQLRNFLRDQVQSVAGQVIWSGLESILYSVMPIGTLPGLPGATASAQGIQFEQMIRAAVSSVVPLPRNVWVEPRITKAGVAMHPGFSCGTQTQQTGMWTHLPRPDMRVSRIEPNLTPQDGKSWFISEFKRTLNGTRPRWRRRQTGQFLALTGYAKRSVYGRLAGLIVWQSGYATAAGEAAETARLISVMSNQGLFPLISVVR
jgi:hypothetical protein